MGTFGERLKYYRQRAGLSQPQFSQLLTRLNGVGFSQTQISALEHRSTAPREDVVIALAEGLHISPRDLYTHENGTTPSLTMDEQQLIRFVRCQNWDRALRVVADMIGAQGLIAEKSEDGK